MSVISGIGWFIAYKIVRFLGTFAVHNIKRLPNLKENLKLHCEIQSEDLPLELDLGSILVKVMKIHHYHHRHVGQTNLTAHRVNLLMIVGIRGIAASTVGDLPTVITGRADFEKEFLIRLQGDILADSPVKREVLAGSKVQVPLV